MNALEIFQYQNTPVSFKNEDGKVFVNTTEIAKRFNTTPKDWLRTESAQRMVEALAKRHICTSADLVQVTKGGNVQQGTWMHEDVALVFAQWLSPEFYIWCNDRIKELLKHGATAINPNDLLNPDFIINLATQLKVERAEKDRLQVTAELQAKELKQSAPKVEYYDTVLQSEGLMPINIIANELGMSAIRLNKILKERKIQYLVSDTWVLCSEYRDKGYIYNKTVPYIDSLGISRTKQHMYWTEKGREFIHRIINSLKKVA